MKAFEIEEYSSEISEKVKESNLTRVRKPISKISSDRTNAWVYSVISQAPLDSAYALGLLDFTRVPISSELSTSAASVMQLTQLMVITMGTQL